MPDMHNVESSNIAAIGYDEFAKELHVQFKGRPTVYAYQDVPRDTFDALMRADSKGACLNRLVKGTYRYTKLEETPKDLLTMTMTRPIFVQLQQLIAQHTICMVLTETSPGVVVLESTPPQANESEIDVEAEQAADAAEDAARDAAEEEQP